MARPRTAPPDRPYVPSGRANIIEPTTPYRGGTVPDSLLPAHRTSNAHGRDTNAILDKISRQAKPHWIPGRIRRKHNRTSAGRMRRDAHVEIGLVRTFCETGGGHVPRHTLHRATRVYVWQDVFPPARQTGIVQTFTISPWFPSHPLSHSPPSPNRAIDPQTGRCTGM